MLLCFCFIDMAFKLCNMYFCSVLPLGPIDPYLPALPSLTFMFMVVVFQRMNVVVKPGLPMLIAGSCSPCVMLSVSAIGVTDTADKNKEHSAKLFEFLTRELGLTEDR